ncbi:MULTISPECIES: hypothetical protein [unclassified Mycobacterium]|uniref:hypothetical protein n=1 Tax=unclassified Mycobacterium TaxID=2642494 RepID=UPI0006DCA693|nr:MULTISPECIES: hypothetical protein [unclassified Mycobacterium]
MGNVNVKRRYLGDGTVAVQINDGTEFLVDVTRWHDPVQRQSIIAAETGPEPQPWWGALTQ